ncbi:MAG: Maf family nucleotide pyrophosphatase [Pseudomonadota bacterium]|nr:Maf family nucleotide pyrophosphatase [Pseudomonadota bacterium]
MLYLASQSPRRHELLARLCPGFEGVVLDIPEHRNAGETAEAYVRRVAREKAGAGLLQVVSDPGAVMLGADTEVVLDDEVFGKPADAATAEAMLRRLSGRTHEVMSAVSLLSRSREAQALSVTRVTFAQLDDAQIRRYVATGEPFGKAGGYAIQGGAEAFVTRLDGSYSGVMGLPLHETAGLLAEFGIGQAADEAGNRAA